MCQFSVLTKSLIYKIVYNYPAQFIEIIFSFIIIIYSFLKFNLVLLYCYSIYYNYIFYIEIELWYQLQIII